ncbi:MAG: two-component regulator propeller domain-containing protein [Acidobacteriota bacterium]
MSKPVYRIIIRALVCLFLAIGGRASVAAQELLSQYVPESWTTERGLPQNTVSAILQTRDGYLWVGTFGGLARFDGVKFTVFDTGNSQGLKSNRILSLCEDRAGVLWIGTEQGGLSRYFQGKFSTYTTKDGLPDDFVMSLAVDGEDGLWIVTSKGVTRFKEGRFQLYLAQDGLTDDALVCAREDREGGVWLIGGPVVMRWRAGRFETYRLSANVTFHRPMTCAVARDGSLWIACPWGLTRFRNGAFTFFPEQPRENQRQPVAVIEGRAGDPALLMPTRFPELAGERVITEPLMARLVHQQALLEDREGNLWIGTGGDGLHRFRPAQVTAYDAEQGLLIESCSAITGDGADGLWLSGGIVFHFSQGKFTRHPGPKNTWTLLPDRQGGLWFGTYDGLHYIKEGHLTHYPFDRVFTGAPVSAIYEDRAGRLWIGAGSDAQVGGLYRFQDGRFIRYGAAEGCALTDVRNITEDRQGALWLGGVTGMSRFRDGKFTNYTIGQGLSHNYVRDIHEDADGTFWIGTYGGGLNRFKDGRFTPITIRQGLYDNIVSRILEDDHGNLWMSCNRGIYRASRRDLNAVADGRAASVACIAYTVADGMKSNETNGGFQSAGHKAPDGRFWFPTVKGVVAIDPNKLNRLPPPVAIEQVLVGQTPVDPTRQVEVRPGGGDLEIHYTGLSLTAPEKARFKYKLDGYDQNWVDVGTRRIAYYTNTAPGRYTFRVMASNNDGIWSTEDAALPIVVVPPFWRTWWFLSGLLAAVAVSAVLGYRYRIRQLEHRQVAREAFTKQLIDSQESERKRIAGELHDSLGQDLLVIKNSALLALNQVEAGSPAHEQFDEISTMTSRALEGVRQITYNLRPYHLDQLGLREAIEFMLEKAAGTSAIQFSAEIDEVEGLFSKEAEMNLYRIVQESVNNIVKHSEASQVNIRLKRDGRRVQLTVEDNGRGFQTNQASASELRRRGFGLIGIAERARMLGGREFIQSVPGQGTIVIVTLTLT